MLNKRQILETLLGMCLLLILATSAYAADPSDLQIQSTSFVPSEECRYTFNILAPKGLKLPAGAQVYVDFPKEFNVVQNSMDSADPGCTLASIQYKNPGDKYYSVLQGDKYYLRQRLNQVYTHG